MNKSNFFPDQRVNEGDMNFIETSRADAVRQQFAFMLARFAHEYSGSIPSIAQQTIDDLTSNPTTYRGIGGGLNSNYLLPITGSLSQISINRGWAITDTMDIIVITGSVTVNQGDNTFHSVWGTLTNGQPAYVTAEYQEASSSVGSDASGNIYYKRYTGDYLIRVSAIYPSGSNQVVLAQFTANGDLITTNTFQDKREWARPWGISDSIYDKSPVVEALNTLYDHTHAVGTGTPTTTNPHGLSLGDLGFLNTVNGILLNDNSITARQSYSASIINSTSNAYLQFAPPFIATASVGGQLYTNSLVPLFASTAPADGTYWVVATPVAGILTPQWLTASVPFDQDFPQRYPTLLRLGQVVISDNRDNIDSFVDYRDFYTISPANIRADFVESVQSPTASISRDANLFTTLDRMRNQIAIALGGSGSVDWKKQTPVSPPIPFTSLYPSVPSGSITPPTDAIDGRSFIWGDSNFPNFSLKARIPISRPADSYTGLLLRWGYYTAGSTGVEWLFELQNRLNGTLTANYTVLTSTSFTDLLSNGTYQVGTAVLDITPLPVGYATGSVNVVVIKTAAGIGTTNNTEFIEGWLITQSGSSIYVP